MTDNYVRSEHYYQQNHHPETGQKVANLPPLCASNGRRFQWLAFLGGSVAERVTRPFSPVKIITCIQNVSSRLALGFRLRTAGKLRLFWPVANDSTTKKLSQKGKGFIPTHPPTGSLASGGHIPSTGSGQAAQTPCQSVSPPRLPGRDFETLTKLRGLTPQPPSVSGIIKAGAAREDQDTPRSNTAHVSRQVGASASLHKS